MHHNLYITAAAVLVFENPSETDIAVVQYFRNSRCSRLIESGHSYKTKGTATAKSWTEFRVLQCRLSTSRDGEILECGDKADSMPYVLQIQQSTLII